MLKRTPVLLAALAGLAPALAHAAPAPVPPIVRKFIAATQGARTLSLDATRLGPNGAVLETGHAVFSRPNSLRVTVHRHGRPVFTLASDGKTLTQWDTQKVSREPAPTALNRIRPSLTMTDDTASLLMAMLISPEAISDGDRLQDAGAATVNGTSCRKVTVSAPDSSGALWFAVADGLPRRLTFRDKDETINLTFSHVFVNPSVAASVFVASPPKNLVAVLPFQPSPSPQQDAEPPLLAVGTPAPDFTLPTADGSKTVSLSGLQGQVVLIDFWASWCPPCKEALPHTQKLSDEYKNKGVTVLAVNTADTEKAMQAFLKAHPEMTMPVLFDADRTQKIANGAYKVTGIPTFYVIDRSGKVAATFVGYDPDEETKIKGVLATLGVK